MKEDSMSRDETFEGAQPITPIDMSEASIRRELRLGALQHPATLVPLSTSAMAAIFILVLSPLFGWLWALVALIISAVAALGSFIWRYFLRYGQEYERRVVRLLEIQDQHRVESEKAEMDELREALFRGFTSAESTKGQELLRDLISEHERLGSALNGQADSDPLTMPHAVGMANETYRRAMSVLSDALRLMEASPFGDMHRLRDEAAGLCREIDEAGPEGSETERTRMKRDILGSIRERIDLLDGVQLRVDRLLFQVRRCEGALQRARVELIAIRTGTSEAQVDSVVGALQATINQVKEVQEELGRLGL